MRHTSSFSSLIASVSLMLAAIVQAGAAVGQDRSETSDAAAASGSQWITPRVTGPGLSFVTYESDAAQAQASFHIYTPPQYEAEKGRRFPVLYWLHGTGGGLRGIAPLAAHFDAAIAGGKIAPMIVVFPNGLSESMWTDSADGRWPVETVLVSEIVPQVDRNYRTIASAGGRIIEGFSMGGFGAARIGFRHPGIFGAISMVAAGPLDPDFMGPQTRRNPELRGRVLDSVYAGSLARFRAESPWELSALRAGQGGAKSPFRQVIGLTDFTAPDNLRFHQHLQRQGIAHEYVEIDGVGHNVLALFAAMGDDNWAFYRHVTGAPQ
jgi:enterochelin esterase-like enzyme